MRGLALPPRLHAHLVYARAVGSISNNCCETLVTQCCSSLGKAPTFEIVDLHNTVLGSYKKNGTLRGLSNVYSCSNRTHHVYSIILDFLVRHAACIQLTGIVHKNNPGRVYTWT